MTPPSADVAAATVREFAGRSGARRVLALLDAGDGRSAVVIEADAHGGITVGEGEETRTPSASALDAVAPHPIEPPPAIPASAWQVDAETGEVAAPVGAVPALAAAVLELATVLGGRSVATADFETRHGIEVTIAARPGEPVILAVGDTQFELPL